MARNFPSSQFDGIYWKAQAWNLWSVRGKTMLPRREAGGWQDQEVRASVAADRGRAVACDELRPVLFILCEGGVRLEAAAAAGFVRAGGTHHNELFAFDKALRINRRVAAAHANGE